MVHGRGVSDRGTLGNLIQYTDRALGLDLGIPEEQPPMPGESPVAPVAPVAGEGLDLSGIPDHAPGRAADEEYVAKYGGHDEYASVREPSPVAAEGITVLLSELPSALLYPQCADEAHVAAHGGHDEYAGVREWFPVAGDGPTLRLSPPPTASRTAPLHHSPVREEVQAPRMRVRS